MTDNSSIADVVMHPVRLRIVQQLGGRSLTTTQLRAALPDVSQATLYRHVATLVDSGVLAVVDRRQVRGTTERTLALGDRMAQVDHAELRAMTSQQLRLAFLTFVADVVGDFDRMLERDDPQSRDYLGFGRVPLYVADGDLAAIQQGLAELLAPYLQDRGDGYRRVGLATLLIPDADAGAAPAETG